MAEKFAIYAGEPVANVLVGYEDQRSGRINQIAAEWLDIIADSIPTFSESEWMCLLDILSSTAIGDESTLKYAWAEVLDAADICEKWGISTDDLSARIKALGIAELYALRETVQRYWATAQEVDGHAEALRRIGAIPR